MRASPGFGSEHWGRAKPRTPLSGEQPLRGSHGAPGAVHGVTEAAFSGGRDAGSQQRLPTRPESKRVESDGVHIFIQFTEMDLQAAQ